MFHFIFPPSFEELRSRIEGRGTEQVMLLKKGLIEQKRNDFVDKYDYVVINNDVNAAANDLNGYSSF